MHVIRILVCSFFYYFIFFCCCRRRTVLTSFIDMQFMFFNVNFFNFSSFWCRFDAAKLNKSFLRCSNHLFYLKTSFCDRIIGGRLAWTGACGMTLKIGTILPFFLFAANFLIFSWDVLEMDCETAECCPYATKYLTLFHTWFKTFAWCGSGSLNNNSAGWNFSRKSCIWNFWLIIFQIGSIHFDDLSWWKSFIFNFINQ